MRRTQSRDVNLCLDAVATYRPPTAKDPGQYTLRPEGWLFFDRCSLTLQQQSARNDAEAEYAKQREATRAQVFAWTKNEATPSKASKHLTIGQLLRCSLPPCPPLAPTSPSFAPVRQLLHSGLFGLACRSVLADAVGGAAHRVIADGLRWALHGLCLAAMAWPESEMQRAWARVSDDEDEPVARTKKDKKDKKEKKEKKGKKEKKMKKEKKSKKSSGKRRKLPSPSPALTFYG